MFDLDKKKERRDEKKLIIIEIKKTNKQTENHSNITLIMIDDRQTW